MYCKIGSWSDYSGESGNCVIRHGEMVVMNLGYLGCQLLRYLNFVVAVKVGYVAGGHCDVEEEIDTH